jgi:DNA-binding MarR family transcriptional regulator
MALQEGRLGDLVGYRVAQAHATTSALLARTGGSLDLRQAEFTLLCLIGANPGVASTELASHVGVTKPNIAMWMDRIEHRGLVSRMRSDRDKRSQCIELTALGRQLSDLCLRAMAEQEAHAVGTVLSPAERLLLLELLQKVRRAGLGGLPEAVDQRPNPWRSTSP